MRNVNIPGVKIKITPGVIFNLFLTAAFAYIVWSASDWRFGARMFPWAIGIPALGLTILQLIIEQIRAHRPARPEDVSGVMDLPVDPDTPPMEVARRAGISFAWVFGLFFGIWIFGFLVAIPLFVFSYIIIMAKARWYESLFYVALILIMMLGLFHYTINIPWLIPIIPGPQEFIISVIGR